MNILENIDCIYKDFQKELQACNDLESLNTITIKYLGRKAGKITSLFTELSSVSPQEKPWIGQKINELKNTAVKSIEEINKKIEKGSAGDSTIDLTLPGRSEFVGRLHPLTIIQEEIISIFEGMGFEVIIGPEIESDYYNFEALNIPKDHPARDLQDTFYLNNGMLLRTHTSPVQIRVMERHKPPIRIIAPGRVFRKDTPDATHSPVFNQVEGLYVDEGVTVAELKGVLLTFARALFGPKIDIRFRSGFFPFTEPSVEYDFSCMMCKSKGCSICKGTGWIEISGAGMVDPAVFEAMGYNSEKYTGYAWGIGIERIAMLKYRIDDIRLFYENDVRFLEQFS